jgi:hypothetical protein
LELTGTIVPELMITCPNKGKEIATGIEVSPNEPRKAARLFVRCPHCGILHGCSPSEGAVKETKVVTLRREEKPADDATMSQWVVEA